MKHVLFITFIFFQTIVFSQYSNDKSVGVFAFEKEIIDYGSIKQNADGKRTFVFKNTGDAPIVVSSIKTSCGCTVASKLTKPILPGETAEIEINYATKKLGAFSKSIRIVSDASEKIKTLRIKGKVILQKEIVNR